MSMSAPNARSAVRLRPRLKAWPATKAGQCAVAFAAASGVGLAAAFAAPDRGAWGVVGMAGVAVGLAFGLASVAPALVAIYLRRERVVSIAAASLAFGGSAYFVARSRPSGKRSGA